MHPETSRDAHDPKRVYLFFALACGLTWALSAPAALTFIQAQPLSPAVMAMAGLSAWGPTLAAVAVAGSGHRRGVFRPFLAHPGWVLLALLTPLLLHLPATLLEVLLGGSPSRWVYLPDGPESIAALVMFSFGEEFGWRGYAQARIAALHGPVKGALLLGLVWAAWHLFMMFSPVDGHFDVVTAVGTIIELPLYSVLFAWFLRRTRGGLAVAIALHMGAHLDNVTHTPDDELRIRVLRVLVLLIAVAFAARSLTREDRG